MEKIDTDNKPLTIVLTGKIEAKFFKMTETVTSLL